MKSSPVAWVLSVVVFAMVGFTSLQALGAEKGKPILIGAPVPRASAYGQNGERGMILAAEEINAAGGLQVGEKKFKVELFVEDNAGKADQAEADCKGANDHQNIVDLSAHVR